MKLTTCTSLGFWILNCITLVRLQGGRLLSECVGANWTSTCRNPSLGPSPVPAETHHWTRKDILTHRQEKRGVENTLFLCYKICFPRSPYWDWFLTFQVIRNLEEGPPVTSFTVSSWEVAIILAMMTSFGRFSQNSMIWHPSSRRLRSLLVDGETSKSLFLKCKACT